MKDKGNTRINDSTFHYITPEFEEYMLENIEKTPEARDPDDMDRLMPETEAARFLGYTNRCLQNWRLRGGGPRYVGVSARSVRYRKRDLLEWIESRLRDSTTRASVQ